MNTLIEKAWVQVTEPTQEADLKVIGVAVLEDGQISFLGKDGIFPEAISGLDGQEITPADGWEYLGALQRELSSPYCCAGDVETAEPVPEIGQVIKTDDILAA